MNSCRIAQDSIRVYVHLAYGFDADKWRERWSNGRIIGINDATPYGYHRAEKYGALVTYSHDRPESLPARVVRQVIRVALGFDAVHAWRSRRQIIAADVVWTHTESQHLAVAGVIRINEKLSSMRSRLGLRPSPRPVLLGQSVWLFDNWHRYGTIRQWLFRRLIETADVLTVHSSENLAIASELFPQRRVEQVKFGIPTDRLDTPRLREHTKLNVLGVGNDQHRDWLTLFKATRSHHDKLDVRVVSATVDIRLAAQHHVEIHKPRCNAELDALYDWADVVVVPLSDNKHASGITVVQEATVKGLPVIATDVGGLRDYFAEDHVSYVPAGDVERMREAILALAASPGRRLALATAAQAEVSRAEIGAESFVRRHVEISVDILRSRTRDIGG